MRALIVGAAGQLGRALQVAAPTNADVIAVDLPEIDVTSDESVGQAVARARPDFIINASAYTAVDRAESEPDLAYAVNVKGVQLLAQAAEGCSARLVHVSTDFVFDGASGRPYAPEAPTAPLNVYGQTKLAGEQAAGSEALIVRTSWLYSATGGNFVRTMLRLMAEKPEVRVVTDQVGSPTYAAGLAKALWALAQLRAKGLFHYCDAGVASWYDFAVAVQEEALRHGLLEAAVPVVPIPTSAYPTPARRPSYSVLNTERTWQVIDARPVHWRTNLRAMLTELKSSD